MFGRLQDKIGEVYKRRKHPYSELALIYDLLMDHVEYHAWAAYIVSIFKRYSVDVRTVLEIACGTGSLSIELFKHGYEMTCMDISPSMLRRATEKFREAGMPMTVFAGDMVSIPVDFQYDAVLCLYDSINYVRNPADFRKAVREVASIIRPGGLFIFDICTVRNSEIFFTNHTMVEHYGDITCERTCRFDPRKRIQENHFIIERSGGKRTYESHYQKIYLLQEIDSMFSDMPFTELGRFDDMTFAHGSEKSMRVHFVLQKL